MNFSQIVFISCTTYPTSSKCICSHGTTIFTSCSLTDCHSLTTISENKSIHTFTLVAGNQDHNILLARVRSSLFFSTAFISFIRIFPFSSLLICLYHQKTFYRNCSSFRIWICPNPFYRNRTFWICPNPSSCLQNQILLFLCPFLFHIFLILRIWASRHHPCLCPF